MCGIMGYVGGGAAIEPVIEGLTALEYRGYDSAGISYIAEGKAITFKQVGRVEALEAKLDGSKTDTNAHIAIGHTRWATHGSPTLTNAHPHLNADKSIFVVHNGIIENYQELKTKLIGHGYTFNSDTDTEVIPHLIDYYLKTKKPFVEAFKAAVEDLRGAYAIVVMTNDDPNNLYIAKLSSPLVIGVGENCHYIASDPSAIMEHTKKIIFLDDYEIAIVSGPNVNIHDIKQNVLVTRRAEELDYDHQKAYLDDYPDYMRKEIDEGPQTIQSAILGRVKPESNTIKLGGLEAVREQLNYIDRLVIVACGTSYYAGMVGEYLIEEIAGIPVEVELASEFRYRQEPFSRSTALLAISQSGETADTIAAIKKVEDYGVLKLGVVNSVGSTISRITDAGVYCHAGPEKSVASTKAFMAQVTVLAEIALYLSRGKTRLYKPLLQELTQLPNKVKQILDQAGEIKKLAEKFSDYRDFLYVGRGYSYACALEGALKLKEISYIHAEGYAAGEMKHGPLAMIDKSFPTVALACDSPNLEKTISNIEEIRTRNGPLIAVATQGNKTIEKITSNVIFVPKTIEQLQPLLIAPVLQLFAYYIAINNNKNVDRPRNLAKSVTVE